MLADVTPQIAVEWDDQGSLGVANLLIYDEVGLSQLFDRSLSPSVNESYLTEGVMRVHGRRVIVFVGTGLNHLD